MYLLRTKSLQQRDFKSKSFNCEKDLMLADKTSTTDCTNSTNESNCNKNTTLTNNMIQNSPKNSPKSQMKKSSTTNSCLVKTNPIQKSSSNNNVSREHDFNLNHIKLNYIDDEEISQTNDSIANNSKPLSTEAFVSDNAADGIDDDDDYDDNVIYEGDSDEINEEYSSHDEETERVIQLW